MPISVPDLCDEYANDIQVLEPLFSNFGAREAFHGPVVTVKCFEDNSLVKALVGTPGNGQVIVVDGGGSLRCALLGDMLAAQASENGWQGLLIYGCVRDVEILRDIDLGIKALRAYPVKSEKRGEGRQDIAVSFASAQIKPGDYLYSDANGIIVASHDLLSGVAEDE